MKIGFIVPSLANLGPILLIKTLTDELYKLNFDITVYYFDDIIEADFLCKTKRISYFSLDPFRYNDIVHSVSLRPDLYTSIYRIFFRKKTVSTSQNYLYEDLSMLYGKLVAIIVGSVWILALYTKDRTVHLTEDMANYYSRYLNNKSLVVINNSKFVDSIDPELTVEEKREILIIKENRITLGVFAKLLKRKGIDQIINVLNELPDYCLLIFGNGPEYNSLIDLCTELGIRNRVYFAGFKSKSYRYLKYVDLAILPSYSEGFPLTLLEAIYFRKPIICSNIAAHRSIFNTNEVSFFDLDNPQSLINAITEAEIHKDKYSDEMEKLSSKYSVNSMVNKYINLYRELI